MKAVLPGACRWTAGQRRRCKGAGRRALSSPAVQRAAHGSRRFPRETERPDRGFLGFSTALGSAPRCRARDLVTGHGGNKQGTCLLRGRLSGFLLNNPHEMHLEQVLLRICFTQMMIAGNCVQQGGRPCRGAGARANCAAATGRPAANAAGAEGARALQKAAHKLPASLAPKPSAQVRRARTRARECVLKYAAVTVPLCAVQPRRCHSLVLSFPESIRRPGCNRAARSQERLVYTFSSSESLFHEQTQNSLPPTIFLEPKA